MKEVVPVWAASRANPLPTFYCVVSEIFNTENLWGAGVVSDYFECLKVTECFPVVRLAFALKAAVFSW